MSKEDKGENRRRRLTDVLLERWEEVRGNKRFPSLGDIDESILRREGVWDDSFIIEVFPLVIKSGYRIKYIGKNLGEKFELNNSGKFVKNLVLSFLETSSEKYEKVLHKQKPVIEEAEIKGRDGFDGIKYRQILLPLGDGEKITHILGGMRFLNSD